MPFTMPSAPSKVGVQFPLSAKLPAGTKINLRTVSEIDGTMSPAATATVGIDGLTVTSDQGQGISELTWLIASH